MYTTRRFNGASRIESTLCAFSAFSASLRFFAVLVLNHRRDAENAEKAQRNTSLEKPVVTFDRPVKQHIFNTCSRSNVMNDQALALRLG